MYFVSLLCLFFFHHYRCFAQLIQPSNNTQLNFTSPGDLILAFQSSRRTNLPTQPITLLPLIPTADLLTTETIRGELLIIYPSNNTFGLNGYIALIACDQNAYDGYLNVVDVVAKTVNQRAAAIILFSLKSQGCSFTNIPNNIISSDYHNLYSLSSQDDTNMVLNGVARDTSPYVLIEKRQSFNNTSQTNGMGFNGGQASPTTAVAMIILYSITGVITALFLIIIVTGAVRAHRHPERYGPRAGHGRPRQSRAKGLARAMLDTLPIVKFGEKEDKPADVEMAGAGNAPREGILVADKELDNDADTVEGEDGRDKRPATEEPAPIAPVEENIGCSICTDDFEKGQDVRVLPCNHQFHPACIDPWLLNVSGTCPLCRIDLRPDAAKTETDSDLPPPLDVSGDNRRSSRRQSLIWDLLNPRVMSVATPQERIAALRRVREERRSTPAEEAEARRRRRLSARLADVFSVRTTRNRDRSPGNGDGEPAANAFGSSEVIQETQAEHDPTHLSVPVANASATQIPLPPSPTGRPSDLTVPPSFVSVSPAPSSPVPESSTAAAARAALAKGDDKQ